VRRQEMQVGTEEKGRATPSRSPAPVVYGRAVTAVPSQRKVVFGHAYAIPAAPRTFRKQHAAGTKCRLLPPKPVDGVIHKPWAPVLRHRGPLSVR
jgi:hypothetical protein